MKLTNLTVGATLMSSVVASATFADSHATELHFLACGGADSEQHVEAVEQFMAENDGVTVVLETVAFGQCEDKALTLAAAGDPPSIAYMGSRTLPKLRANDLIVPAEIDDSIPYQPGALSTALIRGEAWGYPHAFSTKALYINCEIVEASGQACKAPATWDEMYALARGIVDNTDTAGVGLAAKDFDNTTHQFMNYLFSNGGGVVDPNTGENLLGGTQTVEALEFYARLVEVSQEGPTAYERGQLTDLFNDGQIAMYISGPWGVRQHADMMDNVLVAPIPAGPSGVSGSVLISDSIVVFKESGHVELAQQLAQMVATSEHQYNRDAARGLLPIMDYETMGIENPYYNEGSFPVFAASIATGGPEPVIEDYQTLQSIMVDMIQGAVLKEEDATSLVSSAAEALDEILVE